MAPLFKLLAAVSVLWLSVYSTTINNWEGELRREVRGDSIEWANAQRGRGLHLVVKSGFAGVYDTTKRVLVARRK